MSEFKKFDKIMITDWLGREREAYFLQNISVNETRIIRPLYCDENKSPIENMKNNTYFIKSTIRKKWFIFKHANK